MDLVTGVAGALMGVLSVVGGGVSADVQQPQTTSAPMGTYRVFTPGVATAPPETKMLFSKEDAPMVSDGAFGFPLGGWLAITDRFGDDRGEGKTHGGIDIATARHETVFSSCDGTVVVSTYSELPTTEGYGNYVIIQCDKSWSTVYAHLSVVAVEIGQPVERGLPIGRTGSTGFSTGEHLHFEIRYQGQVIDPEYYLDFGAPPREHPGISELPDLTCISPDGVLVAFTPEEGADPTMVPDATQEPTACPTPTPTPTPTSTPEATETPTPEATATPTATPSATSTPSATTTPDVTGTPSATGTPSPSTTVTPTPTPEASGTTTRTPSETATPSETPSATSTATPEQNTPGPEPTATSSITPGLIDAVLGD